MSQGVAARELQASGPEDQFVEIFAQVFGLEKAQLLVHEYPFRDIYDNGRFIDYALRTIDEQIAFEIDGLQWHHPEAVSFTSYEDSIVRQNSLIHLGWKVFRWTDRQIRQEPDRVKEELLHFLERLSGLISFDDFMPRQQGDVLELPDDLELRPHQEQALRSLERLRSDGKTIGLLYHAQGAGKTHVAVLDAKRVGGRTLFLAHRRELIHQARDRFKELWPEAAVSVFGRGGSEGDTFNVVGSIQKIARELKDFSPETFAYLVIDEAHHAAAATYRRVLAYFRPRFVLGLTATPDRADGESVLDLFRDCAHRLSLKDAVELGELVPIRCLRVRTSVDLSHVRFNQIQYNRRDLEDRVTIPARDRLIVDTYQQYVPGRQAVAFCVNVRHGESLAALFRAAGVSAHAVSGQMPGAEREEVLGRYRDGSVNVLCACDILNEGWDCPQVEALLMARPTLSKVIYLQQLGRGTRKAPGKECLIVFDFVDNASRYNQSLSLHRVLGMQFYRPGGLALAPEHLLQQEAELINRGDQPTAVINVGVWARDFEEIDVFSWQEVAPGMLSLGEVAWELATTDDRIRGAVERGEVLPDHHVQIGDRVGHYFQKDRIEEIRQALGLPQVTAGTIKGLFFDFVREMDMSASYKPVMLLAILQVIDGNGRAELAGVVREFREFYGRRKEQGLPVEKAKMRMNRLEELTDADVASVIVSMPFEKFERRRYLKYDRDLAFIRFEPRLWRQLNREELNELKVICQQEIEQYYERINQG